MALFSSKDQKEKKKDEKKQKSENYIRDLLGLTDIPYDEFVRIDKLISHLGTDQVMNFPEHQVSKAKSPAEKQQMLWQWLSVRQNWLIINHLSRLNTNIERLLDLEHGFIDESAYDGEEKI